MAILLIGLTPHWSLALVPCPTVRAQSPWPILCMTFSLIIDFLRVPCHFHFQQDEIFWLET